MMVLPTGMIFSESRSPVPLTITPEAVFPFTLTNCILVFNPPTIKPLKVSQGGGSIVQFTNVRPRYIALPLLLMISARAFPYHVPTNRLKSTGVEETVIYCQA